VKSYNGQPQYSRATPRLHSLRNSLFAEQNQALILSTGVLPSVCVCYFELYA